MLHSGILPHHPRWAKLFENLRYVIIDELHAYRGVFGSHLANILRRLGRVCAHYGSSPVFICSSATIANPRELAERLTEKRFALVERNGAPRGEKFFALVNPPVVNPQLGIRRSYVSETRRLAVEFLRRRLQVIVFAQSRLITEVLTTYLKRACRRFPGGSEAIRGYRGDTYHSAAGTSSTGCVPAPCPGSSRPTPSSWASTSARSMSCHGGLSGHDRSHVAAGRPGRSPEHTVGGDHGGQQRTDRPVHRAASGVFLRGHAGTRTHQPGQPPDLARPHQVRRLRVAVRAGASGSGGRTYRRCWGCCARRGSSTWSTTDGIGCTSRIRADAVSLRSVSSDNFVVVDVNDENTIIGEVDFSAATSTLYEQAIYLVEGTQYQVDRLDFDRRKAYVRPVDSDYYTDAITHTKVTVLEEFDRVLQHGHPTPPQGHGESGSGAMRPAPADSSTLRHGHGVPCPESTVSCIEPSTTPIRPSVQGGAGEATGSHGEVACRCRAWSGSRRSSSTPTRTWGLASSIYPSRRCTPPPTG